MIWETPDYYLSNSKLFFYSDFIMQQSAIQDYEL